MQQTYSFLDALGLDETADARAIRRAYARRLKQVDQAADAAGFQALREAYETALDWAAWEAQQRDQAPPPATDDAAAVAAAAAADEPPAAEPGEPAAEEVPEEVQLVAAVWERFVSGAEQLAQSGRQGDPDAWHDLLAACLADEELVNIGARTQFEWRIVYMLGSGWRPGHEALFPAAVAAFGWAQDRRRLALFDYFGNLLNAAIDQRALFDSQAVAVRSVQDRVAMLLRREKQADRREIVNSMAELRRMQEAFPALLLVVTNADNVAHWEGEFGAHASDVPDPPSRRRQAARWFVKILIVMVAFKSFQFIYDHQSPRPPSQYERAGDTSSGPSHDQGSGYNPRANPPTQAQLAEHLPPLRYAPLPDSLPGDYTVEFEVFLDAGGKVIGVNKMQASELPGLDAAVEAVIFAAKPFPASTARVFRFRTSGRIAPRVAPKPVPLTKSI